MTQSLDNEENIISLQKRFEKCSEKKCPYPLVNAFLVLENKCIHLPCFIRNLVKDILEDFHDCVE